jgi:hypothetical protein
MSTKGLLNSPVSFNQDDDHLITPDRLLPGARLKGD